MSQLVKDLRDVIWDLRNQQVASALDGLHKIVYLLEDVEAGHLTKKDQILLEFEVGAIDPSDLKRSFVQLQLSAKRRMEEDARALAKSVNNKGKDLVR